MVKLRLLALVLIMFGSLLGTAPAAYALNGTPGLDPGDYTTPACKVAPNDPKCIQQAEDNQALIAQGKCPQGAVVAKTFGNKCYNLPDFVGTLLNYLLLFSSIIAGFIFMIGGFNYLTSRGDPSKLGEGRDMITNAVVGLILIATAFAVIRFLNGAFQAVDPGINLLGIFGS